MSSLPVSQQTRKKGEGSVYGYALSIPATDLFRHEEEETTLFIEELRRKFTSNTKKVSECFKEAVEGFEGHGGERFVEDIEDYSYCLTCFRKNGKKVPVKNNRGCCNYHAGGKGKWSKD